VLVTSRGLTVDGGAHTLMAMVDVTGQKAAEHEVRAMAARLAQVEQEERRRLSQVLHDRVQQYLYAIRLKVEGFKGTEAGENVEELNDWIDAAMQSTRELSHSLDPPIVTKTDLSAIVKTLAQDFGERHGLAVRVDSPDELLIRQHSVRSMLYRVIQELLFNVVKHAEVNTASVTLARDGDTLTMRVIDEGKGFDPATATDKIEGSLGLLSSRERISLLGGEMAIDSRPGRGTRITIEVPIEFEN
jgi:two-component system CheB/CheR fusion protein